MDVKTKVSQDAMDTALKELESMEKSLSDTGDTEVEDLIKSLEDEAEALLKSHKEPDGDEDDEGKEPVGPEESDEEEKEKMEKAIAEQREELVKASEAYESLEKSINDGMDDLRGQVETLTKSVNALLNLNVTSAKVIGHLTKSVQDQQESLTKSIQELGAVPVGPSKTVLGVGTRTGEETMEKSRGDIQELLMKSIQAGNLDAGWLSIFGVKGINGLTDDVKKTIGI